jgi:hypothetical protein
VLLEPQLEQAELEQDVDAQVRALAGGSERAGNVLFPEESALAGGAAGERVANCLQELPLEMPDAGPSMSS